MIRESSRSMDAASWAAAAVFSILVMLPLVGAYSTTFFDSNGAFSLDAWGNVLLDSRQWRLLINTVLIALGTTIAAVAIGVPAAFALNRLDPRHSRIASFFIAIPFLVPAYVWVIAWMDMLGANGVVARLVQAATGSQVDLLGVNNVAGVIFVQSLSYYPVVAFFTLIGIRGLDSRYREAASLIASRRRTLIFIEAPMLAPAVFTGAFFVFIFSLTSFAAPSLLQVNVFPVEVFSRFNAFYDMSGGAVLSLPIVLIGIAAFIMWRRASSLSAEWYGGRRTAHTQVRRSSSRVAAIYCWTVIAITALIPIGTMIRCSTPLSSFADVAIAAGDEMATSVIVAFSTATFVCAISIVSVFLAKKGRFGIFFNACVLAFLVSGPVFGIGIIKVWNRPGAFAIVYDGAAALLLAVCARFLMFAYYGMASAMDSMNANMEEAGMISGASWSRRLLRLHIPILAPSLVTAWFLVFILAFGEVDVGVLVNPPGWTTLPVRLFALMHYGPGQMVSALSVMIVVVVLFAAAAALALKRVAERIAHVREG